MPVLPNFICQMGKLSNAKQILKLFLTEFRRIGCFADSRSPRALPEYLKHVGSQADPQQACYDLAKGNGYTVFALQNGGECWTGANAHTTYGIHGQSGGCRNNVGGGWANDVFIQGS